MNGKLVCIGIFLIIFPYLSVNSDTEPPKISNVEANPSEQLIGGYVNITCKVIDNVAVNIVKVNITYPDGSYQNVTMNSLILSTPFSPSHYYNSTYNIPGTYYYYIWANDTSNNWNASAIHTFEIVEDTNPPETYIIEGPSGIIDYNDVTFEWIGTDDFTPSNKLLYSYKLEGYDTTWSPWTGQTSKTYYDLQKGSYTFYVKAKDKAGNIDPTPANRTFTIKTDTIPPTISNVKDYPDPQLVGKEVTISCKVTDNVGVDTVKVIIKYPTCCTVNETMIHIPCNEYYYKANYSVPGLYYYYIWANDTSNNWNASAIYTFEIIEDDTPPTISNVKDYPDPQIEGKMVNISCKVIDNMEVNRVKVNIKYPDNSIINVSMVKIDDYYYYCNKYPMIGTYYYYIWANDTRNNWAKSATYTFEIVKKDENPPVVIIERPRRWLYIADRAIFPTFKPIIIGSITVKAFGEDYESGIEKVEFYVDGLLKKTEKNPPYEWIWNERTFDYHLLSVTAYDKAGNLNTDRILLFMINF